MIPASPELQAGPWRKVRTIAEREWERVALAGPLKGSRIALVRADLVWKVWVTPSSDADARGRENDPEMARAMADQLLAGRGYVLVGGAGVDDPAEAVDRAQRQRLKAERRQVEEALDAWDALVEREP